MLRRGSLASFGLILNRRPHFGCSGRYGYYNLHLCEKPGRSIYPNLTNHRNLLRYGIFFLFGIQGAEITREKDRGGIRGEGKDFGRRS